MPVISELSMTASSQLSHPLRSQRLNQITHEPHSHLDNLVKSHDPFGSPERFSHFVAAQYLFQRDLEKLYNDPQLIRLVPDLPQRCRVEQAVLDLADLQRALPEGDDAIRNKVMGTGEALAWLFVSEGSKLGAAFLLKRMPALGLSETFGARHLGEPEGGRAQGWKAFTAVLDSVELDAEQERLAEVAAIAAFERFTVHLERCFA
jgi:heme oxygenase